ncbi:transposase InsO family protein [Bradyrhizobium ottawaense]
MSLGKSLRIHRGTASPAWFHVPDLPPSLVRSMVSIWEMVHASLGAPMRVNRKRVQRVMRTTGIAALGPKPRTTKPAPEHKIFPYLLRGLVIERPNQVTVCGHHVYPDRPGLPLSRGDHGLGEPGGAGVALSNTMDVSFCRDALEEALVRFVTPETFNTDQGNQFTSAPSPAC